MRLAVAFVSAFVCPALIITAWYLYGQFAVFETDDPYIWIRTRGFFILSLIFSAGFVLLLGVPSYFLLRRFGKIHLWSTLLAGFILGAVPMAIFTWPSRLTSASVNGVQTVIDGIPTMAGWLQFTGSVTFIGGCGIAGAFAFWLAAPNKFVNKDKF